jgi:drug/metabolite transporter (DMT)-like permease
MQPGGYLHKDPEEYDGVDPIELSTFRLMVNGLSTYFVMKFKFGKSFTDIPKEHYLNMFVRSTTGIFGHLLMVITIQWLPITIFTVLNNLLPFFASVASYFILNEVIDRTEIVGMIICFFGVLILIQ